MQSLLWHLFCSWVIKSFLIFYPLSWVLKASTSSSRQYKESCRMHQQNTHCLWLASVLKAGALLCSSTYIFSDSFWLNKNKPYLFLEKLLGHHKPKFKSWWKRLFCRLHLKTARSQIPLPIPKHFEKVWIHIWTFQLDVLSPCDS